MAADYTMTLSLTGTDSTTSEIFSLTGTKAYTAQTSADKRTFTATTTLATIINFGATIGAGQFNFLSQLVFINRSTSIGCKLGFIISGADTMYVQLPAKGFFVLNSRSLDTNTTGAVFSAFADITSVTIQTDSSTATVDYLVIHSTT